MRCCYRLSRQVAAAVLAKRGLPNAGDAAGNGGADAGGGMPQGRKLTGDFAEAEYAPLTKHAANECASLSALALRTAAYPSRVHRASRYGWLAHLGG